MKAFSGTNPEPMKAVSQKPECVLCDRRFALGEVVALVGHEEVVLKHGRRRMVTLLLCERHLN